MVVLLDRALISTFHVLEYICHRNLCYLSLFICKCESTIYRLSTVSLKLKYLNG